MRFRAPTPAKTVVTETSKGGPMMKNPPMRMLFTPKGMPRMANLFVSCPNGVRQFSRFDSKEPMAAPPKE
eukprot:Skav225014  [mRNA]  locus=scaffold5954:4167:5617:+ [translate_table: standard]